MAAYATITPRAIELLDKFFQEIATGDEKNEIDEWLHESGANDLLFDLLLELGDWGSKSETIPMLRKLISQADTKA